jgi:hypothetical protein
MLRPRSALPGWLISPLLEKGESRGRGLAIGVPPAAARLVENMGWAGRDAALSLAYEIDPRERTDIERKIKAMVG